jgi:antibiotic biosynthesis monooxygenase (ABM) superfamily enzyme
MHVNVLTFESPEKLEAWMQSGERSKLLDESEQFRALVAKAPLAADALVCGSGPKAQSDPKPPLWKHIVVVFSALYPTATFTQVVIKPSLVLMPGIEALPSEMQGLLTLFITVSLLNWASLPFAFRFAGPRFLAPDTALRTAAKVILIFSSLSLLAAGQNSDIRDKAKAAAALTQQGVADTLFVVCSEALDLSKAQCCR